MLSHELLAEAAGSLSSRQRELLDIYVREAEFFEQVLSSDLDSLPPGASVLEIGSGIGLLSLLIAARGFRVTSVEPESAGFTQNGRFRRVVLSAWEGKPPTVRWVADRLDALPSSPDFDYAVAINVLEHVPSPAEIIEDAMARLRSGGEFRFVCPNYAFPYEPHFEFPTLISKGLTGRVLSDKIATSDVPEPEALWDELSWPTATGLRRYLRTSGWPFQLTEDATAAYVRRAALDTAFGERKGASIRAAGRLAGLMPGRMLGLVPVELLPIIDGRVRKYRRGEA